MARPLWGERLANAAVCFFAQLLLLGETGETRETRETGELRDPRESLLEGLLASVSEGGREPRG